MANWNPARAVLVMPLLCAVSFAQQTAAPAKSEDDLRLDVVVTAKDGVPVGDLQAKDFALLDNKAAQPITSFRAFGADAPVQVVLVVDAINANVQTVAYERQEMDKYLLANGGRLDAPTQIAIVTDTDIKVQGGGTLDGKMLAQGLDAQTTGLRFLNRSSGFYGAAERQGISLRALNELVDRLATQPGRKLLVWISPGWPLLSGPHVELSTKDENNAFHAVVSLSTRMRQAHVTLYAVSPLGTGESIEQRFYYQQFVKGISKPGQTDEADLSLQVLAVQSGGLVLNGSNDVAALIGHASHDGSKYYEVTFLPAPGEHANEYHQLEVRTTAPGLTARTRQGYYAQPAVEAVDPGVPSPR